MKPYYESPGCTLYCGDCREILPSLSGAHSIVTDPPYGLGFMGKDWDHQVPGVEFWRLALAACRPGAHMLAFGGTRTFHRLAVAIEDAGWELRDTIMWVYGSGFPKSLDASKAIDKAAGAKRLRHRNVRSGKTQSCYAQDAWTKANKDSRLDSQPLTDTARQWLGWGTALKPAWEPILVCRKPLDGTVSENVQKHGAGALNIDGCRVPGEAWTRDTPWRDNIKGGNLIKGAVRREPCEPRESHVKGRWPANLIHDGSDEVLAGFPQSGHGCQRVLRVAEHRDQRAFGDQKAHVCFDFGDTGSAARFFYCAKASRSERDVVTSHNVHPMVKPLALMRYLVRLVTPPGGVLLDPFMGSGTTGLAAFDNGCRFVGIELEVPYCEIAAKRCAAHIHENASGICE